MCSLARFRQELLEYLQLLWDGNQLSVTGNIGNSDSKLPDRARSYASSGSQQ
jgi:hypothetical protein